MAAVLDPPRVRPSVPDTGHGAHHLFDPAGQTLEELILGAWEDLSVTGRAACPVCRAATAADGCRVCGATLT
ncbi:MAG: hypothetical protein ACR2NA_10705 [Solirubrobacterales bacterium]